MERNKCNIKEAIKEIEKLENDIIELIEDEIKLFKNVKKLEIDLDECCERKCDRNSGKYCD